jgi:sucrose phosphorylase
MIPDTFDFIAELTSKARTLGIEVLVEIHSHYLKQIEVARQVDWVYDFALPPLVLHALFRCDSRPLARWLSISPRNAVTVLDTHDGIGVADVRGLLAEEQIDRTKDLLFSRGANMKRVYNTEAYNNLDIYQINCTYYSALGHNDDAYIVARAVQIFAPGIPALS